AWRTFVFDDELLIANSKGIFRIRDGAALEQVIKLETEISDLARSKSDPSRVWMATRSGVAQLHHENGQWTNEGVIPGSPEYVTSVVENDGVVWCGTTFNGIGRIDGPRTAKPKVTTYGS